VKIRRVVRLALVALSLSGCVFAVGSGGDNEPLRDRVRELEKRVDRLEGGGQVQVISIQGEGAK